MASQQTSSGLQNVTPDGVYNGGGDGDEAMETFQMEVGTPSNSQGTTPQPSAQQQQQPPSLQDFMRATQQQLMDQVQAGRLAPTDGQGGGAALQEGRAAHITVNHTYNIHYQSDRPSPEMERDIEAYGQQLAHKINEQCIEKSRVDTVMPTNTLQEPNLLVEPELQAVRYYLGRTGIDEKAKYIPDAKYRKNFKRTWKGTEINLRQLHEKIRDDEECRHVCIVGNPGCGKTVLLKRYARMVLNREIPELEDVEIVHYMKVPELSDEEEKTTSCDMMIKRLIRMSRDNAFDYGLRWMRSNPEKILFIFDEAERVVTQFKYHIERVGYSSKTFFGTVLQNILTNHLYDGCRTLTATRDYPWKDVKGDSRPQKFVAVGRLPDKHKLALTKAVCPGLQGQEFAMFLERHFPAAFSLADDAMHLYFALAALQWGCPDKSSISTDCMLVMASLENMLRSCNSERAIVRKIPKLKKIAYEIVERGGMRFSFSELKKHNLEVEDMHDLVIISPQHQHSVFFRLLDCDLSYFFPHQLMQEVLAATWIGELDMEDFKKFISEKINLPHWSIIRRFVCSMILNKNTTEMSMYFLKKPKDVKEKGEVLLSDLKKSVDGMDALSSYDKMELLASLFEGGSGTVSVVQTIHTILLPDLILEPPDVYILLRLLRTFQQLNKVDICLGKTINREELASLLEFLTKKAHDIKLNVARMNLDQDCCDDARIAINEQKQRVLMRRAKSALPKQKIHLLVNTNTTGMLYQNLERLSTECTEVTIERVLVPDDEANTEEMK